MIGMVFVVRDAKPSGSVYYVCQIPQLWHPIGLAVTCLTINSDLDFTEDWGVSELPDNHFVVCFVSGRGMYAAVLVTLKLAIKDND